MPPLFSTPPPLPFTLPPVIVSPDSDADEPEVMAKHAAGVVAADRQQVFSRSGDRGSRRVAESVSCVPVRLIV